MNSKPLRITLRVVLATCALTLVETACFAANPNSVTYEVSRGGDGSAVVNWTILGGLNSGGVGFEPANNGGNGFNGFILNDSGIFNGSYFTDNLVPVTSADGSQFSANDGASLSSTSAVNRFVAIHSPAGDSFGLGMASAFPGSSVPSYTYVLNFLSGSGSFVLPLSYDAFNVGTYTEILPDRFNNGPYAGPVITTLNVLPSSVPEIDPAGMGSVLALIGGGLGLLERRRRRA